jgi:hypothetical protein
LPGTTLLRFNAASLLFLIAAGSGVLFLIFGRATAFFCILLSGMFLYFAIQDVTRAIPVLSSVTNHNVRSSLVRSNIPGFSAFEFCNREGFEGKVFLLGETRGFCVKNHPCIASSVFDSPRLLRLLQVGKSSQDWTQNLKELGVTRVLVCIPEWRRLQAKGYLPLSDEQKKSLIGWLQQQQVEFNDGHDTVVVSLK